MNIAMITWTLPYPPDSGGKIRSYHILKSLGKEHDVDLFVVTRPPNDDHGDLPEICRKINVYGIDRALTLYQKGTRFSGLMPFKVSHFFRNDIKAKIHNDLFLMDYDLIFIDEIVNFPYVKDFNHIPKILHLHKADHLFYLDLFRRSSLGKGKIFFLVEAMLLYRYIRNAVKRCRNALVCSQSEKDLLNSMVPGSSVCVAGNGVDLSYYEFRKEENALPEILFHGTMDYAPNIDAALYFFDQIYPLVQRGIPRIHYTIAGHNPPPEVKALEKLGNVTVTGYVDDMRTCLEHCTVVMVPLRIGGGTRLKIPEAMASGRAVVSTSIGCEGIFCEDGKHLMIADDPEQFADKLLLLLHDRAFRETIAKNGRRLVEDKYSWGGILSGIEPFCREAVTRWKES